jgi:hypothetical protein
VRLTLRPSSWRQASAAGVDGSVEGKARSCGGFARLGPVDQVVRDHLAELAHVGVGHGLERRVGEAE